MASISVRTKTGKWGKTRSGEFSVGSGHGEIIDGKSTGKIKAVRFHIGDEYAVTIDVADIRAMLKWVEATEAGYVRMMDWAKRQ